MEYFFCQCFRHLVNERQSPGVWLYLSALLRWFYANLGGRITSIHQYSYLGSYLSSNLVPGDFYIVLAFKSNIINTTPLSEWQLIPFKSHADIYKNILWISHGEYKIKYTILSMLSSVSESKLNSIQFPYMIQKGEIISLHLKYIL